MAINIPLQNNYEATLTQTLAGSATAYTMYLDTVPVCTIPSGSYLRITINPRKGFDYEEDVLVESIDTSANTMTIKASGRAQNRYAGDSPSALEHKIGSKVIMSNPYGLFAALETAFDGKVAKAGDTMTGALGFSGTTHAGIKPVSLTTVQRVALSLTGADTAIVYDSTIGEYYAWQGAAWSPIQSGSTQPNASETVAGKVEMATLAEQGAHTETGGTGALLALQSKNTIKAAATYTPAYLTGGTSADGTYTNWIAVSDGEFTITIDGVARNVTGCDFSSVTSMADVATVIQTAIRALTSSTETVTWSTDHFIISSVDTTSSSAITVTSTYGGGSGTDISGAGASDWMDCDTGNGTVTNAVLDRTQDENKVPVLGADGYINEFVQGSALSVGTMQFTGTAGETIDGTGTPQAVMISDGANGRTQGRVYKADADDFTNGAIRFLGFVTSSVATGESVVVYTEGVIAGFTGLNAGSKYFVSDTAGAIEYDGDDNADVTVGYAISATQILITRDRPVVQVNHSTALTASTVPLAVQSIIGFRPKVIIGFMCIAGVDTTQMSLSHMYYVGGTVKYGSFWDSDNGSRTSTGFILATDSDASASDEYYIMTLTAVDDVSFTVTWNVSGPANNITATPTFLVMG